MIYVDTSVVLAQVLGEDVRPDRAFWDPNDHVSSRLLWCEAWVRLHAYGLAQSHGQVLTEVIDRIAVVELSPEACARCLEPFPGPVRTLDALHLSAASLLRARGIDVVVATYDRRMAKAAEMLGFRLIW